MHLPDGLLVVLLGQFGVAQVLLQVGVVVVHLGIMRECPQSCPVTHTGRILQHKDKIMTPYLAPYIILYSQPSVYSQTSVTPFEDTAT